MDKDIYRPQPKSEHHVWILEDDEEAVLVYQQMLELRYHLTIFKNLGELETRLTDIQNGSGLPPGLLIADLRLPDGNFISFLNQSNCKKLISEPFIIVSSCDDVDVLRACFEEGATDYLVKPFMKSELIVKTERLLNRATLPRSTRKSDISIEAFDFTLRRGNDTYTQLTAKELKIFSIFYKSLGRKISRQKLQEEIWGNINVSPKTLDVHIFNLRKKIQRLEMEIIFMTPDSFQLLCDRMDADQLLNSC